jgi:hypothetical protein
MSEWLFPLISTLISLLIAGLLLVRWKRTKDRSVLWWGIGFLSYSIAHLMETLLIAEILPTEGIAFAYLDFIRQSFTSILLVGVLYGTTILLTEKKIWKAAPLFLLFAQEAVIAYCDFVLWDSQLAHELHIMIFFTPLFILFGILFLRYWMNIKKRYAWLLSLAWFLYAAVVPFYFVSRSTWMFPYWFGIRAIANIPLLIGFLDYLMTTETEPLIKPLKSFEAIESPFTAMFDLSEELHERAPYTRMSMNFIMILLSIVMLIGIINIISGFNIGIGTILIILGGASLALSYKTRAYFKRFTTHYLAIKRVREAEPIVQIPDGKTAQERFVNYMKEKPYFKQALERNPDAIKTNAKLIGKSGSMHEFDIYVEAKPILLRRYRGYSLLLRCFNKPIKMKEINDLAVVAKDVTEKTKIIPDGVIALQSFDPKLGDSDREISDDVYEYVMKKTMMIKIGFKKNILEIYKSLQKKGMEHMISYHSFIVSIP